MVFRFMILKFGGSSMNFSERYNNLTTSQKEDLKRVANRLFSIGFLTKKKEDNKKDYYFVENNKDLLQTYFAVSGWELEFDETYGVIHLVNTVNQNRHQFRLYESILLLLIRTIYHEKMQELSLAENVVVTVEELHQGFAALKLRDKPMDKTTFKNALRLFKRFNLLEPLDNDVGLGDTRIIVYPTILLAVKVDDIRKVYEKLESYRRGAADDEEDDTIEAD